MTEPVNTQILTDGLRAAEHCLQTGARSIVAYARAMERTLGRAIRPYLRSFYEGYRYMPGFDTTGMTPASEVDTVQRVLAEIEALDAEARDRDRAVGRPVNSDRRRPLAEVSLAESNPADIEYHRLTARVDADGDLVVAGHDIGPQVEAVWGHDDYEYYRTVPAEQVPRVLLELLKDRFSRQRDFSAWLESKCIASRFETWP